MDESPLNAGVLNSIMLVRVFHTDCRMKGSEAFKCAFTFRYLFGLIKHKIKCDVFAEGDVASIYTDIFTTNVVDSCKYRLIFVETFNSGYS